MMGVNQQHHRDAVDDGRVEEVDAALRGVLTATVVTLAVAAALASRSYGWWYSLANTLPAACLLLRVIAFDRLFGVRAGATLMVVSAFVAGVWGASESGGVGGPGVYFACLVAMFGMIMFPARRWFVGLGAGMVAAVAAIDVVLGRVVDADLLVPAVVLAIAVPAGVERIVALETLHRTRSVIDPLTGCLNRRALENRSIELEEQAARLPTKIAVICFDIDHFKRINDDHGHAVGDRVLSHVAYTVRKQLRSFELVYRTGGEEFVVLLPGADDRLAVEIAERLRSAIEREIVEGVAVTASFGVAAHTSPFDVTSVIGAADEQVYAAKRHGRNRVESAVLAAA